VNAVSPKADFFADAWLWDCPWPGDPNEDEPSKKSWDDPKALLPY
jgi:hypothetical protein